MTTSIDTTIQTLRDSLEDKNNLHEPWTSGVISLSGLEKTIFYEAEDGTPRSFNFGRINQDAINNLSEACQPATFGLNREDVLDETYRKAGKMDGDKIAWRFNPSDKDGFVNQVASALFPWKTLKTGIQFELYKLNVYGQGSFFKPHQDTPRDENMFGSLVVVLPVKHEGGELMLKHRGREFTFNGQALVENDPSASVAYIAFFSDVEHEVAPVLSGHRVTLTYNLYFDSSRSAPPIDVPDDFQLEHPLKMELRRVMENPGLRDAHSVLGFGLEHAYPFQSAIEEPTALKLKGSDALLVKVLEELEMDYNFFLLYRQDIENECCPFRILSRNIIDGDQYYSTNKDMVDKILSEYAWLVWRESPSEVVPEFPIDLGGTDFRYICTRQQPRSVPSLDVEWVTEPSEERIDMSTALVYGNDVSMGYQYHQLCVIARFSPGPPFQ